MNIIKRDGSVQKFIASKVQSRVEKASKGLNIDRHKVLMEVYSSMADDMTTMQVEELIATVSASYTHLHHHYSEFAALILNSVFEKTVGDYFEQVERLTEQGILTENFKNKAFKFKAFILDNNLLYKELDLDYLGIKAYQQTYLLRDKDGKLAETPLQSKLRVAIETANSEQELLEGFEALTSGWSPATPILCNAGTTEGQLASCQLHYLKGDSLEGIMDTFKDLAISSKNKAGIGIAAYNQRGKGSKSSKGWGAAGVVQNMKIANEIMRFFDQGGKRPGSTAWYLAPWHIDVFSFLNSRKVTTHESLAARDMFSALWTPDVFMERFLSGEDWYLFCPNELKKKDIDLVNTWGEEFTKEYNKAVDLAVKGEIPHTKTTTKKVIEEVYTAQVETGMPYIGFQDTANRLNQQSNLGKIKSSNLCVHGDTKILTDEGHLTIKHLENKTVKVWNGEEWSLTKVFKTGENKKLLRVLTSSGQELLCTPEHKFYTQVGYKGKSSFKIEAVEAKALKKSDKLIKMSLPVIEGKEELPYSYDNGFYTGDGCLTAQGQRLYLYNDKIKLEKYLTSVEGEWSHQTAQNRKIGHTKKLKDKYFVPLYNYTVKSRLEWLSGYMDADGCITVNKETQSVQICSVNKEFLNEVQLMLQTLGCDSKVTLAKKEGTHLLPSNNGTGGVKEYYCKTRYRLLINSNSLYKLTLLGLKCNRLSWDTTKPNRECSRFIEIKSVEEVEGRHDTYCFTESKRGMGVFNGILTGQCSEIYQYSDPETTAVCILSSVVAPEYINENGEIDYVKLEKNLKTIVRVLNYTIDNNVYTTKEAEKGAKDQRAIGIGMQGLADVFFKNKIEYGSPESLKLTREFQEALHYYTIKGSVEHRKTLKERPFTSESLYDIERGIFQFDKLDNVETTLDWESLREEVKTFGVSNSMFNCQMPTGTSSQTNRATEAHECLTNNVYVRRLNSGEITVINRYMVEDLQKLGIWDDKFIQDLALADGSLQDMHLQEYCPGCEVELAEEFEKIKKTYKTVWEISQKSRTDICIAMQPFIDQGISMNVYYKEPTISRWSSALVYAWKNNLKTGNYYCRTFKGTANKSLAIQKEVKIDERPTDSMFECDGCSS